jgi:formate dehydrogenase subunit delta
MEATRLVIMANQMADFFGVQRGDAAARIAEHIAKNWDPRMRAGLAAHLAAGGEGLTPLARAAAERLAAKTERA